MLIFRFTLRGFRRPRLEEALARLVTRVSSGRLKNRAAIQRRIGRLWERSPRPAKDYEIA